MAPLGQARWDPRSNEAKAPEPFAICLLLLPPAQCQTTRAAKERLEAKGLERAERTSLRASESKS